MKTIVGIDVGATGALAFKYGTELIIYDIPTFQRNKTTRIDNHALTKILRENRVSHAWIEQVNAFGMGASSAYNFGWNCGCIEAVLSAIGIPFSYVTPQVWKKELQVPTDKNSTKNKNLARMRATQMMPQRAHNWDKAKDHNRAEAALIALYGFLKSNNLELINDADFKKYFCS
jgi:crossover junction endodeoxyribonuclease RuvC